MATTYIPIKKLIDADNKEYYPLSVTKSVYTPVQLKVANNIGGYSINDIISTETCFHDILYKLLCVQGKDYLLRSDIDINYNLPTDTRVPSTKLVHDSLENISSYMGDKQDKETAVTRVSLSSCGSSTLPVYVDASGQVQPITSYNGNADTCNTAEQAKKLDVVKTGTNTKPVYFQGGIPVEIDSYEGKSTTAGTADQSYKLTYNDTEKTGISCGSEAVPIYFDNGLPVAISSTVGDSVTPIYLNEGELTAFSGNMGSNTGFVYVGDGAIKESDADVGSNVQPIYLEDGKFKTIKSNIGSEGKPIYVNDDGNLTEFGGTVGSNVKPVYISSGQLVACTGTIGGAANELVDDDGNPVNVGTDEKSIIYFKEGIPVKATKTFGYSNQPIFISGGQCVPISGNLGSEGNPVYISDDGVITPMSEDIGNEYLPVYMKDGILIPIGSLASDGLSTISSGKLKVKPATISEIGGIVLGDVVLDGVNTDTLNYPILVATSQISGRMNDSDGYNPYLNIVDHSQSKIINQHRLVSTTEALTIKTNTGYPGDVPRIEFNIGSGLRYVTSEYNVDFSKAKYTSGEGLPDPSELTGLTTGDVINVTDGTDVGLHYYNGLTWIARNNDSTKKWFRIWSDGWLEQGGTMVVTTPSSDPGTFYNATDSLYFDMNFTNGKYTVYASQQVGSTVSQTSEFANISFLYDTGEASDYYIWNAGGLKINTSYKFTWKAEGYTN